MSNFILKKMPTGFRVFEDSENPVIEINRFLEALELRGLSIRTTRAYGYDLIFLYRWMTAYGKTLEILTQADLLGAIAFQQQKKAKPRSINRRLSCWEVFYHFHYQRQVPNAPGVSYPASHYKGPGKDRRLGIFPLSKPSRLRLRVKVPKTLVDPLSVSEVDQFFKKLERYRDRAIVMLMLLCGLRSCEIISLKIEDVSFSEGQIKVLGKGNKERMLPIPISIVSIMNKYLRLERPDECIDSSFFVVLQGKCRGKPMSTPGLRSLFRYKRFVSGIKKANAHRFRHCFGSNMAKANIQLPILQRMMGHASYLQTMQYINLSMTDIADKFEEANNQIEKRYEQLKNHTSR